MEAVFEQLLSTIAIALLVGVAAAAGAFLIRVLKGESGIALLVGLETFVTTATGAVLAWLLLRVLLELAGNTDAAAAVFGTLFLIWPGLIDIVWAGITALFAEDTVFVLFDANALPWFAFAVGAGIGMFDGYRRIHRWTRVGVLCFVSDVTWGLPLGVNAVIIHFRNWPGLLKEDPNDLGKRVSVHEDQPRQGSHRYLKGFGLKHAFAFTQGSVISNLVCGRPLGPIDPSLLAHEKVHVFQNRVFGPLFWFTYMFWLIFFGLLGVIVSIVAKPKTGTAAGENIPFWWAYMDNPWEVWAYGKNPGARSWVNDSSLCWPTAAVIALAVVVDGVAIAFFALVVSAAF